MNLFSTLGSHSETSRDFSQCEEDRDLQEAIRLSLQVKFYLFLFIVFAVPHRFTVLKITFGSNLRSTYLTNTYVPPLKEIFLQYLMKTIYFG